MRSLGLNPTEAELQETIKIYDKDDNGTIDFYEFYELMEKKQKETEEREELIEIFRSFDRNGNGNLSSDELLQIFNIVGEKVSLDDLDDLIKQADLDGDNEINLGEFIKFMLN